MKYLVFLLSLLILTSCSPPEVHPNKLVERNGVTYQVNSDKPFTGSSVRLQDDGEVRMRTQWKDGKNDGLTETFYGNGQLRTRVNLKDGKEEGFRELFSPNGVLIERANYKDGKQDGPTERLGRDGEVIRTETWKDGVKIDSKRA
jgi:hypothetical protein